ncbi:hypothetical protein [Legionella clemsonensis]|uniref:Capsule polysaccharide biosynthesis protein n=1 Tax=Legionella clemsonensis TaxID=1867846 RepID=A0A222P3J2_9GAMM|nr:hypothetical protein [Legionella clemsonensis]ASQ46424.1 hypothetical protein clem_09370 [Legionella clemsonensis]
MIKRKILITARDVGAAINIIEIIKSISSRSDCEMYIYTQPPASRYFANFNIPHHLIPQAIAKTADDEDANFLIKHAQQLIDESQPDIILCGLSTPGDAGIDEALIKVAKNKMPTIVMQDFWGEVNDFFGVCADYYFCLDDDAKNLTEKRYPCQGIVIGSPRHSWYETLDLLKLREQLREEINVSSSEIVVGLFGQSLHQLVGYQETLAEFLQTLYQVHPGVTIVYRQHPRESQEQAQRTLRLLKQSQLKIIKHEHNKVEYSLILCDVVSSILSNCLYDSCYLNFFSSIPLITPVALCYKTDIRQHLNNFNMIEASPYKAKNLALICDEQKPDGKTVENMLSAHYQENYWFASKKLENPQHAAERALENIINIIDLNLA